ncbi:MAG TPA: gamma-glutamylcyclotransferase [Candidatus Obscuribacterales bacterium]
MTDSNASVKHIFICGSALQGQPDHGNLQGAKFLGPTCTQPRYRLHAAGDGWHPAIYEVETGGISIPGEVYEMTLAEYEYLLANEPPNMYPDDVVLENGDVATAMLYPKALIDQHQWPDISHYGGWAAYKADQQQASS